VLLHGEKAVGKHGRMQNVDALDMCDVSNSAESSLLASTSDVNSASVLSGAMVGEFCLLATSVYDIVA